MVPAQKPVLGQHENHQELSQSLGNVCASAVFLLDFLISGSDSKHDVCGPFHHFGYFLYIFNSCDDIIYMAI
jgi:hypothetical protein